MEIIKKDVEFLAKCELLDYSLLIGVHERELNEEIMCDSSCASNSVFESASEAASMFAL